MTTPFLGVPGFARILPTAIAIVSLSALGLAAPILNEGDTHTIASQSSNMIVNSNTTLQIIDGADVISESEIPALLGYDANFRVSAAAGSGVRTYLESAAIPAWTPPGDK
jgi:hypothetical protein